MPRIGGRACCRTRRGSTSPSIEPETLDLLWAEHSLRSLALTWNHETDYAFSCYGHAGAPQAGRSAGCSARSSTVRSCWTWRT